MILAGVGGFEPTNARVKVWCLTAWRHPNVYIKPEHLLEGSITWLRGPDLNRRPSGYEPDELPLLHPATDFDIRGTMFIIRPS